MACSFPVKIFRRRGSRASSSSFRPKPGVARCHSWQGRSQKWRGSRLLQGFVFPLSPFIRWTEACLLASCRLRSRSGAKHMAGVLSCFCGGYVRLSCRVLFGAMKLCACRFQFRRRCKWSLVTLRRCAPAIPAYREHYPAPPRPIPPHPTPPSQDRRPLQWALLWAVHRRLRLQAGGEGGRIARRDASRLFRGRDAVLR